VTPGPTNFHVQLSKTSQHRSIGLLAFLVLAVSAFGQSPQIVLGSSQIQSSLDNSASGMAEAFPVTATQTVQVSSLYFMPTSAESTNREHSNQFEPSLVYLGLDLRPDDSRSVPPP
jgi:hypothetical protein